MSGDIGQIRLVPGLQHRLIENPTGMPATSESQEDFSGLLREMVNSVNSIQQEAARAQELMATGEAADLHQVMIAVEKASVSMDLLLEIRNRLVDGWETLTKMPM